MKEKPLFDDFVINNEKEENINKILGFNGLTITEWAKLSRSVIRYDPPIVSAEPMRKEHGSTFPILMIYDFVKCYTKIGDLVVDPFTGVGSTMIACMQLNRNFKGTELNKKYCDYANEQVANNKNNSLTLITYNDDCRNIEKYVEKNSTQLIITSPPYANYIDIKLKERTANSLKLSYINKYSKNDKDFINLSYKDFLIETESLMSKLYNITKSGGYNIWIVKDWRDIKNNNFYVDFHSDVANCGKKAGWKYIDLRIWDQNEHRKLLSVGFPSVFYSNINNSFIIIFRKI
jgi:DNA modification methylase